MSPEEEEEELYSAIADLPHNFKEYVQTELYWHKDTYNGRVFWSRNDGKPELPPNYVGDCWDFILETGKDSTKFNEKIRAAFMDFLCWDSYPGDPYLVQFWAKEEGRSFLTTQHLPFGLCYDTSDFKREKIQGLCEYRMICKDHIYYLDDDTQKQQQQQKHELLEGIPGRVFRNQWPEFSPNVEYYSPTEYPLLQHALRCQVRWSFAIPVFETSGQTCLGVVEMVSVTKHPFEYDFLEMLPDALKDVGLICSVESDASYFEQVMNHTQAMNETHQAAWKEILKVSEVVLEVHKLRLAQIWVPSDLVDSRACTPQLSLLKDHTLMAGDNDAQKFTDACNYFLLRKGYGVVGRAFLSGRLIYCTDVTQFSLAEYSLSHLARQYGFSGCFAICLQSSFTGNDDFVLEFFFPKSFKDGGDPWTSLKEILQKMRENCQSLKLGSGAELTEELPIEVIDFQNGEKLQYVSSLQELLKNGGIKQMDSCGVDQEQIPRLNSDVPSGKALASPQDMMMQDADNVTINAKYGNEIISFLLSLSSGMAEFQHEVTKRLKLEGGTYRMRYKDEEDELVLITCDEDLLLYMHTRRSQCASSRVILLEPKMF